jgi:hypothetical protein
MTACRYLSYPPMKLGDSCSEAGLLWGQPRTMPPGCSPILPSIVSHTILESQELGSWKSTLELGWRIDRLTEYSRPLQMGPLELMEALKCPDPSTTHHQHKDDSDTQTHTPSHTFTVTLTHTHSHMDTHNTHSQTLTPQSHYIPSHTETHTEHSHTGTTQMHTRSHTHNV